MRRDWEKR